MAAGIPTFIVLLPGNFSWLHRRGWLAGGIRRTQIEKLRVLPFIRVLSLLATDQLLDQRGLSEASAATRTTDLASLRGLPADWALLGTFKIKGQNLSISSAATTVPGLGDNGFRVHWEGAYGQLLAGINSVTSQLAQGIARATGSDQTLTSSISRKLESVGLPSSVAAYEALWAT